MVHLPAAQPCSGVGDNLVHPPIGRLTLGAIRSEQPVVHEKMASAGHNRTQHMLLRLLILFTAVPLLELYLLYLLAQAWSWGVTLLVVLGTGMLGAGLARWQGLLTVQRIQAEAAAGRVPTGPMVDGVLILVAGIVLVTPGVLTDMVGLLLLIPPVRGLLRGYLVKWFKRYVVVMPPGVHPGGGHGDFVDVEAHSTEADQPDTPRLTVEQLEVVENKPDS